MLYTIYIKSKNKTVIRVMFCYKRSRGATGSRNFPFILFTVSMKCADIYEYNYWQLC